MGVPESLAVVMITRDRWSRLERTLERLRALPEQPEVVVVDNGSATPAPPGLADRAGVRLLALAANEGAAGRTVGVRAADCEAVAFADDDSWWDPGALSKAADVLQSDPAIGLVAARVVVEPEGLPDPTARRMGAGPLDGDLSERPGGRRAVFGCLACGAVVRSRAYLSVGGFRPGWGVGGEERMLILDMWQAGWKSVYAPEVVARHDPSPARDPARRRSNVLRNDLRTSWSRLPPAAAVRASGRDLAGAVRHPGSALRGLAAAAGDLDAVIGERCAVDPAVEKARRAVVR